jgi:hypothetical protein
VQGIASNTAPEQSLQDNLVNFPGVDVNENSLIGLFTKFILGLRGENGKYSDPEFVCMYGPSQLGQQLWLFSIHLRLERDIKTTCLSAT